METEITKRVKGTTMEKLFETTDKVNIRHYKALNAEGSSAEDLLMYEIKVRHNENESAGEIFDNARSEMLRATNKALDFLCARKPADIDCGQSEWLSILMDFQILKGDAALEALAGAYVFCVDNLAEEKQHGFLMEIFTHDLGERADEFSLPRSSGYREFWLDECEKQ